MKPYDFEKLAETLKSEGLTLTEEATRKLFVSVVTWLETSAKASQTIVDDIAMSLLAQYKGLALKEIDKIDGKSVA